MLDDEHEMLQQRVWRFYQGLLLISTVATTDRPVIVKGAREHDEIGVRQVQDLETLTTCIFRPYPEVSQAELRQAAEIAGQLWKTVQIAKNDSHWRLFGALAVYVKARHEEDLLHRLHQYVRCVDGLIMSRPSRGARDFKSRTELFIGPRLPDLMGEIYDGRGWVEHLHEDRLLWPFDRDVRLELVRQEAIVEHIARTSLQRIVLNDDLMKHFANRASLEKFWAMHVADRQKLR